MKDGFIKVASGTPEIRVADVLFNRDSLLKLIGEAEGRGVKLLVLPELCLTGYTCADLFLQEALLSAAEQALERILADTAGFDMLFGLGLPVRFGGKLYNCAAVCCRGRLLALLPKINIPNYGEFRESRWFCSGAGAEGEILFAGQNIHFGARTVFHCPAVEGLVLGVEVGGDLRAPVPPSVDLAAAGAAVILNLSADSETAAGASYRRELVKNQSSRLICSYIYSNSGEGESTTDTVFSGHDIIAEKGTILAECRFKTGLLISELDINHLAYERKRINLFPCAPSDEVCNIRFELKPTVTVLTREISPIPFVPQDKVSRTERCSEIFQIAALGLKKRIEHTKAKKLVLGVSGGLDSTLALLISARALELLGISSENILAVTMPGFGTTVRTRGNAEMLAEQLGARLKTIPIGDAVRSHFGDIGHDENDHGVVYENAQARERTQVLMDIANSCGGLVVGTGDMSELALGWATYNGDHMSMYGVNSGIPKTLVRHLVGFCAEAAKNASLAAVLTDILATPVSPELLPAEQGTISQKTEELVGPYELHDFFMYHLIRWGSTPEKVLRMAVYAFAGAYNEQTVKKWLEVFIIRFFAQQFKRSCLPDGPRVGTLSLSPRGGWVMPSDAVCKLWLERLEDK